MVVTTSFHGVVFCILHHTPFVYFPLKGRFARGNNRVFDLLKEVGLESRCYSEFSKMMKENIDWNMVDFRLNNNRLKSLDYLRHALK